MSVTVSGLKGQMEVLNGMYMPSGRENHGRPVYSRNCQNHDSKTSTIYYWDERDGPSMQGWWMAPIVGGEEVWAHASGSDRNPPVSGWKVPSNASVDPNVRFIHSSNSNFIKDKRSLPPIDFSEKSAQPYIQLQQQPLGNYKPQVIQPLPERAQKGKIMGQNTSKGKGKGEDTFKGKGQAVAVTIGKGSGKVNKLSRWDDETTVQPIDKTLTGKGKNDNTKGRGFIEVYTSGKGGSIMNDIENIKGNKSSAKGDIKGKSKGKQININPIESVEALKKKEEARRKEEEKKKAEALLNEKLPQWKKEIKEAQEKLNVVEKIVEEYRDVTAALTSDVAEHLSADDIIQAWNEGQAIREKMNGPLERIQLILKEMSSDNLFKKTDLQPEYNSLREKQREVVSGFKDLEKICKKYHNKALEIKKQEALVEKKKEEQEKIKKIEEWNKGIVGEAVEYCIISQISAKRVQEDYSQLEDAQRELKRAKFIIDEAVKEENANKDTHHELLFLQRRNKRYITDLEQIIKRRKIDEEEKLITTVFELLAKFREKKKEGIDLFNKFAVDGKMNLEAYQKMLTSLEVQGMDNYFHQCLKKAGKETSLSQSDFYLFCENMFKRAIDKITFTVAEDNSNVKLQKDEVLNIINYITSDDEKKIEVIRMKDSTKGYVPQLLADGSETFNTYSPLYKCVTETVMTDKAELKGFKVILRLKPGDVFNATEIPIADTETKLLRIHGTSGTLSGYTTVIGSNGTNYLEAVPPQEEKTEEKDEEKPSKLTDEERATLLLPKKIEIETGIDNLLKESEYLVEQYDKKAAEFMAHLDGHPKMEDVEALFEKVKESYKETHDKITDLKVSVITASREVGKCVKGPFGELSNTIQLMPETINEMAYRVRQFKKNSHKQFQEYRKFDEKRQEDLRIEEEKKQKENYLAEAYSKIKEMKELMEKMENDVTTECFAAELLLESIGDDITELEDAVKIATGTLTKIKAWMDERIDIWQTDYEGIPEMKTFCKEDLQSFRSKMFQIRNRMKEVRTKKNNLSAKLDEKYRLGIGLSFRKYLVDNELTSDQLFVDGEERDTLSLEEFLKRCEKVGISDVPKSVLEKNYNCHSVNGITKEQFTFLCTPRMICCKSTSITDTLEIKTAKNLMMIPLHDILDVTGLPEEDTVSKVTRVKAEKVITKGEDTEIIRGYITLKGITSGTVFFQQYKPYFEVAKATVLTSSREMKGLKVVGQLKVGDVIAVNYKPQKEKDLLRVECTRIGEPSISGWCTMLTISTAYLKNVDKTSEQINELIESRKPAPVPTEDVEMTPVETLEDTPLTKEIREDEVKAEIKEETMNVEISKDPVKEEMIEETVINPECSGESLTGKETLDMKLEAPGA